MLIGRKRTCVEENLKENKLIQKLKEIEGECMASEACLATVDVFISVFNESYTLDDELRENSRVQEMSLKIDEKGHTLRQALNIIRCFHNNQARGK